MSTAPNVSFQYQVGGSLEPSAPSYVKRKADQDFYEALKQGELCYVLNSRQMGKSSLRVEVMRRLQIDGVACGVVDITSLGSQGISLPKWYLGMVRRLARSFQVQMNVIQWWDELEGLSSLEKFTEFIEDFLLLGTDRPIVIFIDEIDSMLKLSFKDDFFALIRSLYCQHSRLTFALLGVATPSDLIQDKNRTSFNIGKAIELSGFQLHEVEPLIKGLEKSVDNPNEVLKAILHWTDGQPFLTQKICRLVSIENRKILRGEEFRHISQISHKLFSENWESHDNPPHLKTIRDRLLSNKLRMARWLGLYQQILQEGSIAADGTLEQIELRLSGLVVENKNRLYPYNKIYSTVFNQEWIEAELYKLRPYSSEITNWIASNRQDHSYLLHDHLLRDAWKWALGKTLSDQDYDFLVASQERALWKIRVGSILLTLSILSTITGFIIATTSTLSARNISQKLQLSKEKLETVESQISNKSEELANKNSELSRKEKDLEDKDRQLRQKTDDLLKAEEKFELALDRVSVSEIKALNARQDEIQAREQNQLIQKSLQTAENTLSLVQYSSALERRTSEIRELFQTDQISALLSIIDIAQEAEKSIFVMTEENFDGLAQSIASSLKYVLQNIREANRLEEHQNGATNVQFSQNGQSMITTDGRGTVRIWNINGMVTNQWNAHTKRINDLAFHPAYGGQILTVSKDKTIRIWDMSGREKAILKQDNIEFKSVNFGPRGLKIIAGSGEGKVFIWTYDTNKEIWSDPQIRENSYTEINDVFFIDDTQYVTADAAGSLKLWEVSSAGDPIKHGFYDSSITSLAFHLGSQSIAFSTLDGTILIWHLRPNNIKVFASEQGNILNLELSPDGDTLAIVGEKGEIKMWKNNGQLLPMYLNGHVGTIYNLDFSPDGKYLATSGRDGTVRLWKIDEPLNTYEQTISVNINLNYKDNLNSLLTEGCSWLEDYLYHNETILDNPAICP